MFTQYDCFPLSFFIYSPCLNLIIVPCANPTQKENQTNQFHCPIQSHKSVVIASTSQSYRFSRPYKNVCPPKPCRLPARAPRPPRARSNHRWQLSWFYLPAIFLWQLPWIVFPFRLGCFVVGGLYRFFLHLRMKWILMRSWGFICLIKVYWSLFGLLTELWISFLVLFRVP